MVLIRGEARRDGRLVVPDLRMDVVTTLDGSRHTFAAVTGKPRHDG